MQILQAEDSLLRRYETNKSQWWANDEVHEMQQLQ